MKNNAKNFNYFESIVAWLFISLPSWVVIYLHGKVNTHYYKIWVDNCAKALLDPNHGHWYPGTFEYPAYFFMGMQLTFILLIARTFDFTTKKLQIFFLITSVILIWAAIQIGLDYSTDTQRGMDFIPFLTVPFAALCTGFLFGIACGAKFIPKIENKKVSLQLKLSLAFKALVWSPLVIVPEVLYLLFGIFFISWSVGLLLGAISYYVDMRISNIFMPKDSLNASVGKTNAKNGKLNTEKYLRRKMYSGRL